MAKPAFRLTGDLGAHKFDARSVVTEIKAATPVGKASLAGSVVRIGKEWSVVKSSGLDHLVVWGKFTDGAAKVDILHHCIPNLPQQPTGCPSTVAPFATRTIDGESCMRSSGVRCITSLVRYCLLRDHGEDEQLSR